MQLIEITIADDWIQTMDPLVSETTALPTEPQPLPYISTTYLH